MSKRKPSKKTTKRKKMAKRPARKIPFRALRGVRTLAKALRKQSGRMARLVDMEVQKQLKLERAKPYLWRTRTGLELPVTEMETSHLQNTISYLQRRISYAFGTATWLSTTRPMLEALLAMLKEAERRQLDV